MSPIPKKQQHLIVDPPFDWDYNTLTALRDGTMATDVDAWGVCGLFYRPYLNWHFGPPQWSTDADVCVRSVDDAVRLDAWLRRKHPWRRWSISPDAGNAFPYGERAITMRLGAVRLRDNGRVEVAVAGANVIEHLQRGIVALQESNAKAYGGESAFLDAAVGRARKLLREYPGLRLEGRLATIYAERYGPHEPTSPVVLFTPSLAKAVRDAEMNSGAQQRRWRGVSDAQKADAMEIVAHYRTSNKRATPVPVPPSGPLPPQMRAQRNAKRLSDLRFDSATQFAPIDPPQGYETWMHWMCMQASDAMFREWLLNQSRSRHPYGGRDTYLRSVLDLTLYREMGEAQFTGQQKITHGGWMLDQHLVLAGLNLCTRRLLSLARRDGWNRDQSLRLRAGMRLGMLHHDIGKIVSINTPGAHNRASAAMWDRTAPKWVDAETKDIARFVILGHDVFGRLARAITEKVEYAIDNPTFDVNAPTSYRGAMGPDEILDLIDYGGISGASRSLQLRMLRCAWEADIGSVQVLRWALPISGIIERLLSR